MNSAYVTSASARHWRQCSRPRCPRPNNSPRAAMPTSPPEGGTVLQPALPQLLVQLHSVARHSGCRVGRRVAVGRDNECGTAAACAAAGWKAALQQSADPIHCGSSGRGSLTAHALSINGALCQALVQLLYTLLLRLQQEGGSGRAGRVKRQGVGRLGPRLRLSCTS